MRYGIPINEFYNQYNPKYMEMKQKAYIDSIEAEYDKINHSGWVHGQYIISAIQKALDPKKAKYPDKPFDKNEEVQQNPEIQAMKFKDWADAHNKKFQQKHDDSV